MNCTSSFLMALALSWGIGAHAGPDLIKAATKGNLDLVVERLAAGEKINEPDSEGWTPLMWSVYKHRLPVLNYLLEKGADPDLRSSSGNKGMPMGSTALILASNYGMDDLVAALMKHKAKVDVADDGGNVAAIYARRNAFPEVLGILARNGCPVAKAYQNCSANICFADAKALQKPYRILSILTQTERNGYDQYILDGFKVKACQAGGDALTEPEIQTGPRNTTITVKIIVWDGPRS